MEQRRSNDLPVEITGSGESPGRGYTQAATVATGFPQIHAVPGKSPFGRRV